MTERFPSVLNLSFNKVVTDCIAKWKFRNQMAFPLGI